MTGAFPFPFTMDTDDSADCLFYQEEDGRWAYVFSRQVCGGGFATMEEAREAARLRANDPYRWRSFLLKGKQNVC